MIKCRCCGANLKETGVICDSSVYANWDEENNRFELSIERRDYEAKCPECYTFVEEQVIIKE